jgi:predicted Rossmann fold nucleotide-binding protein DprA/Smf involved in DNA uptake
VIRAFTGPSSLTHEQTVWVARRILVEPVADTWRSGAAYGIDSVAAYLAVAMGAELELFVPAAKHNEELVDTLITRNGVLVIRCGSKHSQSETYRRRNKLMVKGSDHLLAFVKFEKTEWYRSGEWMTINIARKLGIPVKVVPIP